MNTRFVVETELRAPARGEIYVSQGSAFCSPGDALERNVIVRIIEAPDLPAAESPRESEHVSALRRQLAARDAEIKQLKADYGLADRDATYFEAEWNRRGDEIERLKAVELQHNHCPVCDPDCEHAKRVAALTEEIEHLRALRHTLCEERDRLRGENAMLLASADADAYTLGRADAEIDRLKGKLVANGWLNRADSYAVCDGYTLCGFVVNSLETPRGAMNSHWVRVAIVVAESEVRDGE